MPPGISQTMSHPGTASKKKVSFPVAGHRGLLHSDVVDDRDDDDSTSEEEDDGVHNLNRGKGAAHTFERIDEEDEDEDDGEDDEDEDVEPTPFEYFASESIDRLDTIANALVTDEGAGVADVLASISDSLQSIAKILYAQAKTKR